MRRHRRVAAMERGRRLGPDDHVHHVDLDHGNDHPGNLAVLTAEQHAEAHRSYERLGHLLLEVGLFRWNGTTYDLSEEVITRGLAGRSVADVPEASEAPDWLHALTDIGAA